MVDGSISITIESHDGAAVVYASGALDIGGALRLVRTCEQLIATTVVVRVDMGALTDGEAGARELLETRLRQIRVAPGRSLVVHPLQLAAGKHRNLRLTVGRRRDAP